MLGYLGLIVTASFGSGLAISAIGYAASPEPPWFIVYATLTFSLVYAALFGYIFAVMIYEPQLKGRNKIIDQYNDLLRSRRNGQAGL